MSAREALESRARSDPDRPFLFFRSPRGTFTWWSFARAAARLGGASRRDESNPSVDVPGELLDALESASASEFESARALLAALGESQSTEIWISARPLERPEERRLALCALLAGWAVVREPGDALRATLLLWVRPTLLSGSEDELIALIRALPREAPRWRRARWLARRLARLGTVLVERDGSTGAVERELETVGGTRAGRRVLPFPESGW